MIELVVGDLTKVGDGSNNNSILKLDAVTVINDIASAVYAGTVNTSGTLVTWESGMHFQLWWAPGSQISINGTMYTVVSVTSVTAITVTASAGTQTGVSYSFSS